MNILSIRLFCECCKKVHEVTRTDEIPENVNAMACNYCIECEDKMEDYYNEWYIEDAALPEVENPNQLKLFQDGK